MKKTLFICAVVALLSACSGPDEKVDKPIEQTVEQTNVVPVESKCDGNRVPPTNYRQETAFVALDTPNATDYASQVATERLRDKICQGYRCHVIEAKITIWNTETDATQVCAMAVVKAADVHAFLKQPAVDLAEGFKARSTAIVASAAKKSKSKTPRLAFDNVRDIGVDGGPRAAWLVDKMSAALASAGADTVKLPPNWSGLKLPDGVDGVVTGRVTKLHGRESMLEITWKVDFGSSVRNMEGIAFPEMIGPVVDPSTHFPDISNAGDAMSMRFDARNGGGLCPGDTTELVMEVKRPMHTRIVNLYGDGSKGLIVYASDGQMKSKKSETLMSIQAVRAGDVPVERLLAFGAKKKTDLGVFANTPVPCRIPESDARKISSDLFVPQTVKHRTSRSYRILSDDECGASEVQDNSAAIAAIANYPSCW